MKVGYGNEMNHGHECVTIGEQGIGDRIKEAISIIEPEIKKQFYKFKEEKVCKSDFLSYLLGVCCQVSVFFLANCAAAEPESNVEQHIMTLLKGLCMFHGVDVTDHRMMNAQSVH